MEGKTYSNRLTFELRSNNTVCQVQERLISALAAGDNLTSKKCHSFRTSCCEESHDTAENVVYLRLWVGGTSKTANIPRNTLPSSYRIKLAWSSFTEFELRYRILTRNQMRCLTDTERRNRTRVKRLRPYHRPYDSFLACVEMKLCSHRFRKSAPRPCAHL